MERNIIKIRIFFWTLLLIVVVVLFYLAIVPFGKISYSTDFCSHSEFIGKITPEERLDESLTCTQKIIGNPVYFSLRTPRTFDKAKLTIRYKTSENYPGVIEIGPLVDKVIWRYDLKPIENEMIDKLALVWDMTSEGDTMFLQKEKKYSSIEDFVNEFQKDDSSINTDEVLLYNYDLKKNFILKDYISSRELSSDYPEFSSIEQSLRGSYQFYTYIKNEDLDFNFNFIDLNKNKDEDNIEIIIYYDNQIIDSERLEDDGIKEDSGQESQAREFNLHLSSLPEGVNKIEIKANDDIITKNIETSQSKFVFVNKIWFYNEGLDDINIYTNSDYLQFNTTSPESRQKVMVDDKELNIEETYNQYAVDVWRASSTKLSKIVFERDGVMLSGNGLFSFSPDEFFDPVLKKINQNRNLSKENINYILARYKIPQKDSEWKVVTQEFDLKNVYREFYKYGFIISVSELSSEDGLDDFIEIDSIKVELEGRTFWQKLKEVIK